MGVETRVESCRALSPPQPPQPPQQREEWVPKAEERKNSLSGGRRGGAVQEGAEMVRGVSPRGPSAELGCRTGPVYGRVLRWRPAGGWGTLCGQGLAQG